MATWKRRLPILLVLLLAAALRLLLLDTVPPGLTHDEANHGREALGVLAGIRPYYFPYNYGSEPLYSYTVAGILGLVGGHVFGLRLLNALLGVLTVAATYAWGRRALERRDRRAARAAAAPCSPPHSWPSRSGPWPPAARRCAPVCCP